MGSLRITPRPPRKRGNCGKHHTDSVPLRGRTGSHLRGGR
nr:MAG TPA: hypothetical protein [Caudoviricetes sp.]